MNPKSNADQNDSHVETNIINELHRLTNDLKKELETEMERHKDIKT